MRVGGHQSLTVKECPSPCPGVCAWIGYAVICCGPMGPVFLSLGLPPSPGFLADPRHCLSEAHGPPGKVELQVTASKVQASCTYHVSISEPGPCRPGRVGLLCPSGLGPWEISSWRLDFPGSWKEKREKDPDLVWGRSRVSKSL